MKTLGLLLLLLALVTVTRAEPPVKFEPAFPKLRFRNPLFLTYPPDGSDRIFVVEQGGRVLRFDNRTDAAEAGVAIDLSSKIPSGGEEGLLGLAFHPKFKENRRVFLLFTRHNPRRDVLARFTTDEARATIDPASEEVVLEINEPYPNHNGGMIAFGPDGYLYVGLGDGGAANDPHNNGQNLSTLLAKIIRIDVDHKDAGLNYAIPKDNPFAGREGRRSEIWAYGLRNPWRFSFDRKTGDLWAGDVGQNKWEEIDLITKGGNYGWRLREGKHDFNPVHPMPQDLIDPVVDHPHGQANCITGGYVYRGKQIPAIEGCYLYGDFATSVIWSLRYEPGKPAEPKYIGNVPLISSFGEDRDGEVYVVSLGGTISKIVPR